MSETTGIETTSPPAAPARVIKLWTPKNIFWLGFFLGWPTALVLCIINWFRMGMRIKAVIHTIGGFIGIILFFTASYLLTTDAARVPLLLLNLLLLAFFQSMMRFDFIQIGYPNPNYKQAGIGWGILIGILTLAVLFGCAFFTFLFIELVKIIFFPTPNQPLPGMEGLKEIHEIAAYLKQYFLLA